MFLSRFLKRGPLLCFAGNVGAHRLSKRNTPANLAHLISYGVVYRLEFANTVIVKNSFPRVGVGPLLVLLMRLPAVDSYARLLLL